MLIDNGNYVIVKRFTTNEERKRICTSILKGENYSHNLIALENRLNYFHKNGKGLEIGLAKGLALYLNSNFVDSYFRQFNGHTQVNASDLREYYYPSLESLLRLGNSTTETFLRQEEIDKMMRWNCLVFQKIK